MQRVIKRFFDIVFSLCCSVFAIPIMAIAIVFIYVNSPKGSPFFKQMRVGYKGKPFVVYKLRTMTNEVDEKGNLLSDELRLKRWGRVIRKLSIDELPQIWNILAGQMSWIGPRPLLANEMCVMTTEEQRIRQSVLPGITGWEAVHEGESTTRTEMAQYDIYYVKNWSLWLDVKIFFMTVMILFAAKRAEDEYRAPKVKDEEVKNEEVYTEK